MEFLPPSHPLLRQRARQLTRQELASPQMQQNIDDMLAFAGGRTLPTGKKGNRLAGLMALQVGIDAALALVNVTRRDENGKEQWTDVLRVLVNPRVVSAYGEKVPWWHGCYSTGPILTVQWLPRHLTIEALDREGNDLTWEIDGVVDGPRQLHVAHHELWHGCGIRHTDTAIDEQRTLYVVDDHEYGRFDQDYQAGLPLRYRTLPPQGWIAMRSGEPWEHLVVKPQ